MTLDRKKSPIFAQIRVLFFERANTQLPTKLPTKKGRKLEHLIFNRDFSVIVNDPDDVMFKRDNASGTNKNGTRVEWSINQVEVKCDVWT